ncbi:hypothetical protein NW762_003888 [Fusarium torreyae]|uniref:Uncharacterized protein n=1 Tax=Fusarium torreyae TaxID=1237075 RepID=A0A9W8SB45_9HYPO|nr:hypothetical protein NW762_003888 [Fusarium torreyae]
MRFGLILFVATFAGHSVACNPKWRARKQKYFREAVPRLSKLADEAATILPNGTTNATDSGTGAVSAASSTGTTAGSVLTTITTTTTAAISNTASASSSTATSTGSATDGNDSGLQRRSWQNYPHDLQSSPVRYDGKRNFKREDAPAKLKEIIDELLSYANDQLMSAGDLRDTIIDILTSTLRFEKDTLRFKKYTETTERDTETTERDTETTERDTETIEKDADYEDKLYEKIGNQIKDSIDKTDGEDAKTAQNDTAHDNGKPNHHSYVVTETVKLLEHDGPDTAEAEENKEGVELKDLEEAIEEDEVEFEEKEDKEDEEDEEEGSWLGGDEKKQYKRLTELYMQYRPLLVEPIREELDPILKGDEESEAGEELAKQYEKGIEKEQRKRITNLYSDYGHLLVPSILEKLDPILGEDERKAREE